MSLGGAYNLLCNGERVFGDIYTIMRRGGEGSLNLWWDLFVIKVGRGWWTGPRRRTLISAQVCTRAWPCLMNGCTLAAGEERGQAAASSLRLTYWQWYLWQTGTCDARWIFAFSRNIKLEMSLPGHISSVIATHRNWFWTKKRSKWSKKCRFVYGNQTTLQLWTPRVCPSQGKFIMSWLDFHLCKTSNKSILLTSVGLNVTQSGLGSSHRILPDWFHLWFSIIPHHQSQKNAGLGVGVAHCMIAMASYK